MMLLTERFNKRPAWDPENRVPSEVMWLCAQPLVFKYISIPKDVSRFESKIHCEVIIPSFESRVLQLPCTVEMHFDVFLFNFSRMRHSS